jgi:hypothetical protein
LIFNVKSKYRTDVEAGIAVRLALQEILVLRLGLPEAARQNNFSHNSVSPKSGGVDSGDDVFSNPLLVLADVENG